MPTNIGINLAGIAGVVAITKKESKSEPRLPVDEGSDDGIAFSNVVFHFF